MFSYSSTVLLLFFFFVVVVFIIIITIFLILSCWYDVKQIVSCTHTSERFQSPVEAIVTMPSPYWRRIVVNCSYQSTAADLQVKRVVCIEISVMGRQLQLCVVTDRTPPAQWDSVRSRDQAQHGWDGALSRIGHL